MPNILVIGASGFLGNHLINALLKQQREIKVLSRNIAHFECHQNKYLKLFQGDLLQPESLKNCIDENDIIINLAYLYRSTLKENILAMKNLAEISSKKKIKRLIHCSTVMVCGDAAPNKVTENTPCYPRTNYEVTKFQIEQLLLQYKKQFEIAILRPSAVFGPNGKNLLKLANNLKKGNYFLNYLKSCLLQNRKMNLVCIDNVISAIQFLIDIQEFTSGNIFIISDDDDIKNNYKYVEGFLKSKLCHKDYRFPSIPWPLFLLSILCKFICKKNFNPRRTYQGDRLSALGFEKPVKLYDGLSHFVTWYLDQDQHESLKR